MKNNYLFCARFKIQTPQNKISILTSNNYISKLKSITSKSIQFYAYYWGRCRLINIEEKDEYSFFAEAASNALDFKLSIKDEKIFMHEIGVKPLLLTDDIETLFQNPKEYPKGLLYDNRPSLEDLYNRKQMYKTNFRDPEDFEIVASYQLLMEGIDNHFDKLINIQSIKTQEEQNLKSITLITSKAKHEIQIHKELFDMEAIRGLNQMLRDLGQERTLHLTIDPQMYMVMLLLTEEELDYAKRIGLIV